jgi:hypothetical protein
MMDVVPQMEKDNKTTDELIAANQDNLMAVDKNHPQAVIPPTATPNLAPLLTGHNGQEVVTLATDKDNASDKNNQPQENDQADDMAKAPSKKKSKKSKTTKEDTLTKRDRSG